MLWRLFALDPEQLTPIERTLLRVALLVAVFVLGWTWYYDNRDRPGDDLRNRVVGARVMLTGQDPYTFQWQSGMAEELLDPVHDPEAHRLTISPPTLLLYAPVAPLPWRAVRLVSFVAEWLAMVASFALLCRALPENRYRVMFLVVAVLFVLATDVWRLHLERGQVYVFQLLALSAAITWSRRGEVDSYSAGIALGLLSLMRPNLLVMAPALLLAGRWRMVAGLGGTIGVGIAATALMLPMESWRNYLAVGDQYYASVAGSPIVSIPRPEHDGPVEGVEFAGMNSLTNITSSSFSVVWRRLDLPPANLGLISKMALAALALLLLALTWLRRNASAHASFALIVVLALDTEFFLPHRWGYADVLLLAPLALLLPELMKPRPASLLALSIVLIGLVSGPFGQMFFDLYVATLLRAWLVMAGLTWFVISDAS